MTERNYRYMYWELLHSLDDLESELFREHWFYRLAAYGIHTNRWEQYSHLQEHAREYMEEKELYEQPIF